MYYIPLNHASGLYISCTFIQFYFVHNTAQTPDLIYSSHIHLKKCEFVKLEPLQLTQTNKDDSGVGAAESRKPV